MTAHGPVRTCPARTCIGCGRVAATTDLVRFARTGEATVAIGPTLPGRGAWLCAATLQDCAASALRCRAFERALRGPIESGSVQAAVATAAKPVRSPDQNARG